MNIKNINNLNNRLSVYFMHHIFVKIRMSPSPTTTKEVFHLYQNFKKLGGSLEYFEISRGKNGLNTYSNEVSLIYNPSSQLSQLDPFNGTNKNMKETTAELLALRTKLTDTIHSICAIPRYSYVENDEQYVKGEIEIPYKFRLNRDGLKYDKRYSISTSTVNNQFCFISPAPTLENDDKNIMNDSIITNFKSHMRHNFQKFHKFDNITISPAIPNINHIIGRQKLDPLIKQTDGIKYSSLMDLNSDINTMGAGTGINLKLQRLSLGFTGFYD